MVLVLRHTSAERVRRRLRLCAMCADQLQGELMHALSALTPQKDGAVEAEGERASGERGPPSRLRSA